MKLDTYLADLEERIDIEEEERIAQTWLDFADLRCDTPYFEPRRAPHPPTVEWKPMLINDALESDEGMVYQQLCLISDVLRRGGGDMLCLRSNFGTGIIPGIFGAETFIMPRETNTLPGSRPLAGGIDAIRRILDAGRYDFESGYAKRVFTVAELYLSKIAAFPKLQRYLSYYNPDLQGPLSLCEATWGSDIYADVFDEPELVEQALDFFADVYIDFTKKWHALCPPYDATHSVEWGCLHRGGTIIRNDAAMNISGEMYRQYVAPRDQRIIDAFGGGVHFCGRGHHFIGHVAALRGLSCINLSQPDWNDMEIIYQNTIDRDIIIFGMVPEEVERATQAGRPLRGRVHCGASQAAWREEADA